CSAVRTGGTLRIRRLRRVRCGAAAPHEESAARSKAPRRSIRQKEPLHASGRAGRAVQGRRNPCAMPTAALSGAVDYTFGSPPAAAGQRFIGCARLGSLLFGHPPTPRGWGAADASRLICEPSTPRRGSAMMNYQNIDTGCIDDESMPWMPFAPYSDTVTVKYFKADPVRGKVISLPKAPPGTTLPRPHHTGTVIVYTVQGRWKYIEHDWVAGPKSVVFETAASEHTPLAMPDSKEDII